MRDLLDAPPSEWMMERAKVEIEGWGARLLLRGRGRAVGGHWEGEVERGTTLTGVAPDPRLAEAIGLGNRCPRG